jgi:hypothetical protein
VSPIGKPCVGIVYKTLRDTTYCEWYHSQAFNYPEPSAETWLKDRLWWKGKHLKEEIMCVVRAK